MGPSKGVKGKVRLPSPDDDGMAQDLRSAIRAKHRLVEQMKEDVKDIGVVSVEDRDGDYARGTGKRGARFPFWKIVVVVFAVAVFFAFLTGGATAAEKATRAMRHRYQLRKSLENEEKAFWRSERVLRHFGLRRLSQLRFTDEIHTGDDLFIAVRDPETHFLTVPVSHSTQIVTKRLKGGNGVTYEDVAVVSHSSYHGTAPNDGLTFESFIKAFIASGSNKGLVVALKDPRVVVAVVKALQQAVTSRSVQSPIVLHAEVLPGPRGFLPQMACVFKNASAYHDGFLWDDYDGDESTGDTSGDDNSRAKAPKPPLPKQSLSLSEFQFATANDALVPFDPVLFVRTAASRLPGAVLAPGVATGGLPCAGVEGKSFPFNTFRLPDCPYTRLTLSCLSQVQTNSDADAAWSYAEEVGKNGGESAAQLLADAAVHGGFRFDNFRAVRKFVKNDALRDLQVKVFNFEDKSTGAGSGDGHDAKSVSNSESAKGSPDFDSVPLPEFFAAAKAKRFKKRADGLTGEINALGVAHRKRVNGFVKAARAEILDGVSRVGNGAETKDKVETSTTPPDVPTDDASNRNNSKRRKLSQMEFEVMAEAEAAQQLARQNKFMEEVDVSANDRAAFKLNTYSYESEAFALLNIRNYGPEIGVESLRLLRNARYVLSLPNQVAHCLLPLRACLSTLSLKGRLATDPFPSQPQLARRRVFPNRRVFRFRAGKVPPRVLEGPY